MSQASRRSGARPEAPHIARPAARSPDLVSSPDLGPRPDLARRRSLETLLHDRIVGLADVTPPWDTRTRTAIATLGGGEQVVAQWSRDRRAMARRLRLGRLLPRIAPGIPLAGVVAGDSGAGEACLVTRVVSGRSGRELLAGDETAVLLGRRMGELARTLADVPTHGLRLSTRWGDAGRLATAARGWLTETRVTLGPAVTAAMEGVVHRVPVELGGAEPVFAHGDLAPVNVLVRGDVLVALLDFERARVAHPLFDAAWWRWIVLHHHPERWNTAGPAFFASAGLALDRGTVARLDLLSVLQCLERLRDTPRSRAAARAEWAGRLVEQLGRT